MTRFKTTLDSHRRRTIWYSRIGGFLAVIAIALAFAVLAGCAVSCDTPGSENMRLREDIDAWRDKATTCEAKLLNERVQTPAEEVCRQQCRKESNDGR